jgi:two-component system NtrC family response regulator
VSSHRILIVDRASNIRSVLSELLTDEGFDVITANNNDEAVLRSRVLQPAAILIELESERDLAAVSRLSSIPNVGQVVALTAFGRTSLAIDALRCGAGDYVMKPFSRIELLVVVQKAVEHYELAREVVELRLALGRSARPPH